MNVLEKQILDILGENFLPSAKYLLNNVKIYDWESDYLAITQNMYSYEVEVKVSRQDYRNDFRKVYRHERFSGKTPRYLIDDNKVLSLIPNYFYYAFPEIEGGEMIKVEELPEYAGLLIIDLKTRMIKSVKKAPLISKIKFDPQYYNLTDKFYSKMNDLKSRQSSNDSDKRVIAACEAIRRSAEKAFALSCPDSGGSEEYPLCKKEKGMVDCCLQCDRGAKFKKLLE